MKTLGNLPQDYVMFTSPHIGPTVPGGIDDVSEGNVAIVLDVLHLLPVSVGLLQSLDQEGSSRGADSNLESNQFEIKKLKKDTLFLCEKV